MSVPVSTSSAAAAHALEIEQSAKRQDSMGRITVRKFMRHKFAVAGLMAVSYTHLTLPTIYSV